MDNNINQPNAMERQQIIGVITGQIQFGGDIIIDDDDNNGHFAIMQTWTFNGQNRTRTIQCKLDVISVDETVEK